jgi:hypothetical protein
MAFSLLDLEDQQQPATSLLPLPDDRPAALQPDPRAEALGGLYQQVMDRIAEDHRRALWSPDNPIGTETVQTLGMPQRTVHAGPVGQYIDPATGRMTEQGQARMADNPALGFDTGGVGMIKAYHGSPHQFDAFDASKIGTGEGAQAYGHGMYLSEGENVARSYRENLSNPALFVNGEKVGEIGALGTDPVANAAHALATTPTPYAAKEYIRQSMDRAADGNYGLGQSAGKAVLKAIDDMAGSEVEIRPGGHMYEVNVNADPERFLHWDKPLSEQHPDVIKALNNTPYPPHDMRMTGREYLTALETNREMASKQGDPAALASQALQEAGIPGIRYFDKGSRGAGEGSHNYVVFDANTMNIIRRYGLAGLMAGGGAAALSRQQSEQ